MRTSKSVLRPERLRHIERPFGWLPCRLLTDGLLTSISPSARQLYLVLALAADRQGLSCFGDNRLQRVLDLADSDLEAARAELLRRDWIAFDGSTYQLLSLPPSTRSPPASSPRPGPSSSAARTTLPLQALEPSPDRQCQRIPQQARQALKRIFGDDFR
jgi:hypothetical protein